MRNGTLSELWRQLVNVLMSVPYQQEAQVDLLEDVQADEQGEESKHEDQQHSYQPVGRVQKGVSQGLDC